MTIALTIVAVTALAIYLIGLTGTWFSGALMAHETISSRVKHPDIYSKSKTVQRLREAKSVMRRAPLWPLDVFRSFLTSKREADKLIEDDQRKTNHN